MAERPIECSHCKKPIAVTYKEILDTSITCNEMCATCPILEQKLHGYSSKTTSHESHAETGMCCGNCRTTLESIKMGNPLGCSECYAVFANILVIELTSMGKVPLQLLKVIKNRKNQTLHLGKSPDKSAKIPSSNRLVALNEALNDALKKENYEQAAWLRDQINTLLGKNNSNEKI
ncbi:MAG: UvrB/UvrC motif-containing protein [Chlamydiales bacterium]|jgi:protein arginine kinase activator|nr:UvrB/UvrC motif-containing protein [Chlamydiales bacterium]